jgi:aspartate ammonia-lyase
MARGGLNRLLKFLQNMLNKFINITNSVMLVLLSLKGGLQATYPNDNSNIFHSTAQIKPQEQQLNKLASYTKLKLHKLQQASKSKQPIT